MTRLSEMEAKARATEDGFKKQVANLTGELAAVKNRNGKLLRCYRSVKNTFDEVIRSVEKLQSQASDSPPSLEANVSSEEIEPNARA
jgi:predicted nuclease with TOPRIM domain